MSKHHLYYSNKLENNKDGISVWKSYRRDMSKIDKDSTKKINKDYTLQKNEFNKCLEKSSIDYNIRYSKDLINSRKLTNIEPLVFLNINSLGKIKGDSDFFKKLKFDLVIEDNSLRKYIVKQKLEDFNDFQNLIENFIKSDQIKGDLKMLSLINDFSIVTSNDRVFNYCNYFINGINSELHIKFFNEIDEKLITSIFEKISLSIKFKLKDSYNLVIIENTITKENFDTLINIFDNIKGIYSSNYNFKLNSTNHGNELLDIQLLDNKLSETVCIVDSGIQDTRVIGSFIDKSPLINYSFDGTDLFEDKGGDDGHGTGVASIVVFGNQILNGEKILKPFCNVCSIKVINDFENKSDTIDNIINKIEEIYLLSNEKIKIFNLSIGGGYLNYNHISSFGEELDLLMHRYDLICVISAGNLYKQDFDNNSKYPYGWCNIFTNLNSPAESINGLTVGSIYCESRGKDYISFYSAKDNYKFPDYVIKDSEKTKYRKKPDLVAFGGDGHTTHFKMIGPKGNIVFQSGTSFSAPFVSHLLVGMKNIYSNVRMTSLKALLINKTSLSSISESTINFYNDKGIDIRKIYGNGTLDNRTIDYLSYGNENDVTVIIEDEIDFSNYSKQNFPFLTLNIKMPKLEVRNRNKKFLIKATLSYNPIVVNNSNIGDYNPCFIAFNIHDGKDNFNEGKSTTQLTGLSNDSNVITGWSDTDYSSNSWNNTQTKALPITKNKYNRLIEEGMQITIKARLKDDIDIINYYKDNPQQFSLVLNVIDMDNQGILYDEILNNNTLINANQLKIKLKEKISI